MRQSFVAKKLGWLGWNQKRNDMNKIIGYHGTYLDRAHKIVSSGFRIPDKKEKDDYWLGHGIYFYDNKELGIWWGRTKAKRQNKKYNQNNIAAVVNATICYNDGEYLDLNDTKQLQGLSAFCKELEADVVKKGLVFDFTKDLTGVAKDKKSKKTLWRKRCLLLDCYRETNNIAVTTYSFDRTNQYYDGYNIELMLGLTYRETQICVSDNEHIGLCEICYIEEDVI